MPQILDVLLYGRKVGQIIDLGGDRNLFAFDDAYMADPARPTLSLGFKGARGGVAYQPRPRQTKADPFFSNLLPEGKLRDYLAERDAVHPEREFQLLRLLGDDLPGAVQVRLVDGERDDAGEPPASRLAPGEGPLKFSLAGVQMKLSALKSGKGLTIPASGKGGRWIVKFPSESVMALPQNEYWMMTLARRVGLNVPDLELVEVGDIEGMPSGIRTDQGPALAVRRFDRTAEGGRIHMEDFAQVFRIYPRNKYGRVNFDQIGEVVWREAGEDDFAQFIARLVFSAAIGNGDMHAKNWSLLHPPGERTRLAPAYDFVSTLTYVAGENLGLNLAGSKAFEDVSLDSFEDLAKRVAAPAALARQAAITAAERFHEEWPALRDESGLPNVITAAIDAHGERVPLLRARRFFRPAQVKGVTDIVDTSRPAILRVNELADLFEDQLAPDQRRVAGAVTATFAFAFDNVAPLLQPAEGLPWSGPERLRHIEEVRGYLRALALEASDPAVVDTVRIEPPFRPKRGRNISLTRVPTGLQPLIGEPPGAADRAPWWLLGAGAGAIQRVYTPADEGALRVGDLAGDIAALFAFTARFAEAFPEVSTVALDVRWRGLTQVRIAQIPADAGQDERRFTGPLGVADLGRRTRAPAASAVLNTALSAFRMRADADVFERQAAKVD